MSTQLRLGGILACIVAITLGTSEIASGASVTAERAAVASDHEIASRIGVEVLQAGGNAADAAVAVGLALGVVNPQASGIGGGGFLLYAEAGAAPVALNFRETAPAGAFREMFQIDGTPIPDASVYGGLAVAVPGEVRGWQVFHERYGRLPWASVVLPAAELAASGFPVGRALVERREADPRFVTFPALVEHFTTDGATLELGAEMRMPRLAEALRIIADNPDDFYTGSIADDLVAVVRDGGGILTHEDLAGYQPEWVTPLVTEFRGYEIYGMPPPSSGGLVIAESLLALEQFHLGRGSYDDAISQHIIMQSWAHAFADRATLLGDPNFVQIPVERFSDSDRIHEIIQAFRPHTIGVATDYGQLIQPPSDDGTSHFSIVDSDGNAVSATLTINTAFGSHLVSEEYGVLLNNQMDDFSSKPGTPNVYGLVGSSANAIEPGKRPLSSMSPTIVERDGELIGALGASGGPMIITATELALLQLLEFGATPEEAVSSPRFHHQWLPFAATVEASLGSAAALATLGYEIREVPMISAVQVVWKSGGGWIAASDPRKHGIPAGY